LSSPIRWSHHLRGSADDVVLLLSRVYELISVIGTISHVVANGHFTASPRVITLVETAATVMLVLAVPTERSARNTVDAAMIGRLAVGTRGR
jgi:hypothetical protein